MHYCCPSAWHAVVCGRVGIDPPILNLGNKWRWLASFTPRRFYRQLSSPETLIARSEEQRNSWHFRDPAATRQSSITSHRTHWANPVSPIFDHFLRTFTEFCGIQLDAFRAVFSHAYRALQSILDIPCKIFSAVNVGYCLRAELFVNVLTVTTEIRCH